jgi:uncharacterized protein (DUF4415 family)
MKREYEFSKAKRGAVLSTKGKTRITIFLDDAVIARFKALSERTGRGYQTLINEALNAYLGVAEEPMTRDVVRRIVREELAAQD